MNLKKIIAMGTACMMISGLMSGCSGTDKKNDAVGASTETSKKITITWLGPPYNPTAQEDTIPERFIEEKFNVDIKPIFLSAQNFNEQKAMKIAGGEKIDIIYEMDPANVVQDQKQQMIMELPYGTIKKYAPTVFEQLNKEAPNAWLYARVGNKNYGIPNLNFINSYPRFSLWREDWLKNVGINKVPETLDEMEEALTKFTFNDPDGNKKNDTYGMTGDITNWHTMFTEVFGAYGVLPFNWIKVNEKAVYGGLRPGVKSGLKVLAKWYKAGIIHPDFITDNAWGSGKDKFLNSIVGYTNVNGGFMDPNDPNSIPNVIRQLAPNGKVVNGKPVKGPDGKMGKHIWGKPCHIVALGAQVEKDPEKMVRILSILEALVSDEDFTAKVHIGEKDKEWTYDDKERGLEGGIKFLSPFDDNMRVKNECFARDFSVPSFYALAVPMKEICQKYTRKEEKDAYEEYADPAWGMGDIFGKPDTLPSASKFFSDLRTKQINLMVQIIKGEKSVDDYKEFENMWKAQGGIELEKEAAQMSSSIDNIYNEVGVKK